MTFGRASVALALAGAATLASLPASADTSPPPPPAAPPPAAPPPGYGPGYAPPPPGYGPGYAPAPQPYYAPPPTYYGPAAPPPPYYGPGYYRPGYVVSGPYVYRSPGAMIGGIIGVSLGGIFLISAAIVAAEDTCGYDSAPNYNCSSNTGAEVGLVVAGVIGIAVGVPLLIYGARRVPASAVGANGAPASPLPKWAGMPAGKGWRWEF
jgi:hypothetical protein